MGIHKTYMGLRGVHGSGRETHRPIRRQRPAERKEKESFPGGYHKAEPMEAGTGPPEADQMEFWSV